ncbi:hypothetical protein HYX12_03460 [Candidatus Woesearchaeota archaeon]|nr:hypothetical protein [Candidatus Woesearchaeota archaeon]
MYGLSSSDVDSLKQELVAAKGDVIHALEELYSEEKRYSRVPVPMDNSDLVRRAEDFLQSEAMRYHSVLGSIGEKVSPGFKDSVSIGTTSEVRSQYHNQLHRVSLSIPATVYFDQQGNTRLNVIAMVRAYAHESLGHALNHFISRASDVPDFLKRNSTLSEATQEAVALFMEQAVFDELRDSPGLQRELGIDGIFEDVYREFKLSSLVKNYHAMAERYAIGIVSDSSLGNPYDDAVIRKKIELVDEVALNPAYAQAAVISHTRSLSSSGTLSRELLKELMYCVPAVKKALSEFEREGIRYEGEDKEKINRTLLTGLWSPEGFVENARLRAQEK